jgi:putative flippase GtrA
VKSTTRFVRYFLVGGTAAAVDIGLFLGLISIGWSYQWAGILGFTIATAVNFLLAKRYVFHDRNGKRMQEIVGTYLVSGVGLLLNQFILWICIERILLSALFGKLVATGMVFFWNYFIRNLYVFKNRP